MKKRFFKINPWIGFNDVPFIILGTPLIGVLVTMIFFGVDIGTAFLCMLENFMPSALSTLVFWLGDRYITIWFRKKFQQPGDFKRRIYLQSLAILAYTAVMAWPLKGMDRMYDHVLIPNMENPGYLKSFVAALFATVPISAIYEAAFFINRWKSSIAEAEVLKREVTQSQLETLKSQVNPHFFFNSLNALSSLIPEDPQLAVQFVQKLSSTYRRILDVKDKTFITLSEEMGCLDDYLFLMKTRFGDNLHFHVNIEEEAKRKYTIPMACQMLVENAVKHNIVSHRKPLTIKVYVENEMLVIENNLQRKEQEMEGSKMGLANIESRYKLTFHKSISVEENANTFKVSLPLIAIDNYTAQ